MRDKVPLSFASQITWNSKKKKTSTDPHPLFFGYRSLGYILLLRLSQSPTQKLYALGALTDFTFLRFITRSRVHRGQHKKIVWVWMGFLYMYPHPLIWQSFFIP